MNWDEFIKNSKEKKAFEGIENRLKTFMRFREEEKFPKSVVMIGFPSPLIINSKEELEGRIKEIEDIFGIESVKGD